MSILLYYTGVTDTNESNIRNLDNMEMNKLNNDISMNGKVCIKKKLYNIAIELTIRSIEPTKVLYIRHTGSYKGWKWDF